MKVSAVGHGNKLDLDTGGSPFRASIATLIMFLMEDPRTSVEGCRKADEGTHRAT